MHSHHHCEGHGAPLYSVHQSLDELEFERGIWGTAIDGNIEKLKAILDNVNPSLPDSSGYTALHYASRNGNEVVCKILLQRGANPNAQTHGGATPLHRAAYVGNLNIVLLLLQYNADPSICDSDGKTALHKAAEGQHQSVIKCLAEFNPGLIRMKDKRGFLASFYIKKDTLEQLVSL